MTFWLTLNSVGLLIVGALVYMMLRQLGFVLHHIGPVGARSTSDGPRIGESIAPQFPRLEENPDKAKLLVFMSEQCAVCKLVREGAERVARDWNRDSDIYLIYDCQQGEDTELQSLARGLYVKKDSSLRDRLGAKFVPFAAVTDSQGIVVSKGLVNGISHVESLLEFERAQRRSKADAKRLSYLGRGHSSDQAQPGFDGRSMSQMAEG